MLGILVPLRDMQLSTLALAAVASITIVALLAGCFHSDRRLSGRWRSNQLLTLPTFTMRETMPLNKQARFDDIFGKLVITYKSREMLIELPTKAGDQPFSQRVFYRVVASDADTITIAYKDILTGQSTTRVNHFDGPDRYWVVVGTETKGGREYFDRIKP